MSQESLPVIVIVSIVVLTILAGAVRYWAKVRREKGEADASILELVERAISELKEAMRREAREITSDQLMATAKSVYECYIRSTALSKFITEDQFTDLFLEVWERVVGVQRVVALALESGGKSLPPP